MFALATTAFAPAATADVATKAPRVELLDAGNAPRQVLLLAPAVGTTSLGLMTMRMKIAQSGAVSNVVGPTTIKAKISTTVTDRSAAGSFDVAFQYPSFEVQDNGSQSSAQLRAMRKNLAVLGKLTGTYTIGPNGVVSASHVHIPTIANATVSSVLHQLSSQVAQLAIPLPAEPVGVGGRWRVTTQLDLGGIKATQTYVYTLRARHGTVLDLDVRYTQRAPRGRIHLPGVPTGAVVNLTRLTSTGSGTSVQDLNGVFSAKSHLSTKSIQMFRLHQGGQSATLLQRIDLEVTVAPAA